MFLFNSYTEIYVLNTHLSHCRHTPLYLKNCVSHVLPSQPLTAEITTEGHCHLAAQCHT